MRQAGLFGLSEQLQRLLDCGEPLETMVRVVDFEMFRHTLEKARTYGDGAKGGRAPITSLLTRTASITSVEKRPSRRESALYITYIINRITSYGGRAAIAELRTEDVIFHRNHSGLASSVPR